MALILDGNGLIQGLSAGGLPDGSVNANSLASTLDLSSKTMTFGNVTASGITFPASQSASGNPNTLDDYEEGTWTPTVVPASGSITAYTATGRYTKIGRVAIVRARVVLTTVGTANGYLQITNLPFTSLSNISFAGYGRETQSTGFSLSVDGYENATSVLWQKYDAAFLGANGYVYALTLIYETT